MQRGHGKDTHHTYGETKLPHSINASISGCCFLGQLLSAGLYFVLFATTFLNKRLLLALTFNTDGKVTPTVSLITIPKFFHSMQEVTGPQTTTVDTISFSFNVGRSEAILGL